jgi:hypothetical protein
MMNNGYWETETRAYTENGNTYYDYVIKTEWWHIADNHYGFKFGIFELKGGVRLPMDREIHDFIAIELDNRVAALEKSERLHRRTIFADLHIFAVYLVNG